MTYAAIVSGLGESSDSYAHGLSALRDMLRQTEGFHADRFAWTDRFRVISSLSLYADADPVLVGHSFGGSVCMDVAAVIGRPCRVFLIDPVPTDVVKRWKPGFKFVPTPNVTLIRCYRRTKFLAYPRAKNVQGDVNISIPNTDHNSVVMPACREIFELLY